MIIDSFSKYPEVFLTEHADSKFTMLALRQFCSREGIPRVLVTDNGTHFSASVVHDWLSSVSCV